jgi:hypothetical protein
MTRSTRRTLAVLAATMVAPAVACVIADPPAQLPVPPQTPPWIESANVTPPVSVLESWPLEFVVPVYSDDPSATIAWQAFLDYDPASPTSFFPNGTLDPSSSDDAGVRILETRLSAPADLNDCHTIEIIVAAKFTEPHVPAPPGGDSITWFYSPTGSLADCPIYDAGPPDASEDATDSAASAEAEAATSEGDGGGG